MMCSTHPKVSVNIDVHESADLLLGVPEYRLAGHDAGVVDQDGHLSYLPLHLLGQLHDGLSVCDVTSGMSS